MSNFQIEVTGFEELKRKIIALSNDKDKRKEVLSILRQVAKSTLDVAKQKVPVSKKVHVARGKKITPGNLRSSLGLITSKANNPTILVGARAKNGNDGWYAHFVHEGVNVYKKGFKRKRVKGANNNAAVSRKKGTPFLRNAYEQTQGKVIAESEQRFAKFIQRRIDKLSK